MASAANTQIAGLLDRATERGAASLSDSELLAVLLRNSLRGQDLVARANELLRDAGSLRQLLCAAQDRLSTLTSGLQSATIAVSLELAKRHYLEELRRDKPLESPAATRTFLVAQLRDKPYEVFCCLYLDNRHRLISFQELFRGTVDGASVHPRECVREALARNAAAVVFAHNHPSGVEDASQADELITHRLKDALALVDIRVLDHFIVGATKCLSFAERGLL